MSKLSRIGWGSLALIFLATFVVGALGVVFSALGDNSKQDQSTPANACQFSAAITAPKLASPSVQPAGRINNLKIIDRVKGSGEIAKSGSCLVIKYYGALATSGKKFDQNYNTALGLQFPLGQSYVIPGMDEGLVGMKVGGTRELLIPSRLGYGKQSQGPIPANSDLIFIVKLVSST